MEGAPLRRKRLGIKQLKGFYNDGNHKIKIRRLVDRDPPKKGPKKDPKKKDPKKDDKKQNPLRITNQKQRQTQDEEDEFINFLNSIFGGRNEDNDDPQVLDDETKCNNPTCNHKTLQ